jgi:RNA polymerase sigma factor (sigma-70 family)
MEKKAIILSNGAVKEMTYEEVLVQFNNMMHQHANHIIAKTVFNKPEKEDVMQELRLQAWEAFNRYDGEHAFSTYLYYRMRHGVHRATGKAYAKKRTNIHGTVSMSEATSSNDGVDNDFESLLGECDGDINSVEFNDLLTKLDKTLNEREKIILQTLIDKDDFSVRDLGDALGMSRQGANKNVAKFREKIGNYLISTGYVEN